ncbi:M23 family metallopeptidase [Agromyces sp. NPDC058136]|uniref:M23 family metallopeptidase n=1 Tax=Agromyces sp. NPDC058136 TaxID=3346354 RepID=UPI0036D90CEC
MQLIKAARGNINTGHGEQIGRGFPHVGIDIGWGGGTALYAPAAGWLTWSWVGTYGNLAKIVHPDGSYSRIAHADAYYGVNGRQVEQREHIGTMGRTGGPWGTSGWYVHCHQEYWVNGAAVDPQDYFGSDIAGDNGTPLEDIMTAAQEAKIDALLSFAGDTQRLELRTLAAVENIQARLTVPGYPFDFLPHISNQITALAKTLGADVDEAQLAEQLKGIVTDTLKAEIVAAVVAAIPDQDEGLTKADVVDAIRSVRFVAE